MELKFDISTVIGILQGYYQDIEQKNVLIGVTQGKIITSETYLPKRKVINFEIIEKKIENDFEVEEKKSLSNEELLHIIRLVLKEANFYAMTIELTTDERSHLPILKVYGNKIHTKII